MSSRAYALVALWCYVCASLAAAGCLLGLEREGKRSVIDVMLVIDITQSMLVDDVSTDGGALTRLAFAKKASQEMLLKWPCGSRVALALFSGHRSFVMFKSMEICAHHEELWKSIEAIDWRVAWIARSEVSKGLFSAMKVLPDVSETAKIVFVTDGHEAPPLHEIYRPKLSASIVKGGGVVVGVGGGGLRRIPKYGPNGESQGFWRASEVMQVDSYRLGGSHGRALVGVDRSDLEQRLASGKEHLSSLKEQHLRDLSALTEMQYATANSVDDFEQALSAPILWHDIDAEETLSRGFALLALGCLLLRLTLPLWLSVRGFRL